MWVVVYKNSTIEFFAATYQDAEKIAIAHASKMAMEDKTYEIWEVLQ